MTRVAGGGGRFSQGAARARRGLALAALLVAAAPAPAQPAADCARHEGEFPALLGRSEAAVRAALGAMPGIRAIRAAASPSMAMITS